MTSAAVARVRQRRLWARARLRGLKIALGVVLLLAAALAAFWAVCMRMPQSSHHGPQPAANTGLGELEQALRKDVAVLADRIGERNTSRPAALDEAARYIEARLLESFAVVRKPGVGKGLYNLEVDVRGSPGTELVVVGAHYDSAEGATGANDNGSGVAATLALARAFSGLKPARSLRFVFFVNEEPPYFQSASMGSLQSAIASRKAGERIIAMLSLETLGYYSDEPGSQAYPFPLSWFYPDRGNFVGFVGNLASCKLVRRAIATFRAHEPFPSEGGCMPESMPGVGWSDHWAYWQQGYPALMVTDTAVFRYPHYHTRADSVDKVDFARLARVVRGLGQVVGELSSAGDNSPH